MMIFVERCISNFPKFDLAFSSSDMGRCLQSDNEAHLAWFTLANETKMGIFQPAPDCLPELTWLYFRQLIDSMRGLGDCDGFLKNNWNQLRCWWVVSFKLKGCK